MADDEERTQAEQARERAAYRQKRAVKPPESAFAPGGRKDTEPAGLAGPLARMLVPQNMTELGLQAALTPVGGKLAMPLLRALGAAGAMAIDPDEAQAKIKQIIGAPALISRNIPSMADINAIMNAAVQYGRKGWPETAHPVFKTTPEAYAETTKLVPQQSVKAHLPGPASPDDLPLRGRAYPIIANTPDIAENIAQRLAPMVESDSPLLKFYHTGPVIRGLGEYGGLDVTQANQFMRNWAGQGAATSPRTQTPPNLRNASYLMFERARGNPLTPERYAAEGNRPGFPMMGMHVNLAEDFATRGERPWMNPKPFTFRENWSGNLADVTADTHNIRSTLYEMDRLQPGSLPRGWFANDKAYVKYRQNGFGALDAGDIVDTLGSTATRNISRQTEYLPMAEPWYQAAGKLGIHPAEAQSGGWFSYGPITGLQSPPKTIVNLLNDQVGATAQATGVPPQKIVDWWSKGLIPLAGVAGTAGANQFINSDPYRSQY